MDDSKQTICGIPYVVNSNGLIKVLGQLPEIVLGTYTITWWDDIQVNEVTIVEDDERGNNANTN